MVVARVEGGGEGGMYGWGGGCVGGCGHGGCVHGGWGSIWYGAMVLLKWFDVG